LVTQDSNLLTSNKVNSIQNYGIKYPHNKAWTLVQGLELLSEFYALGLDQSELNAELRQLVNYAIQQAGLAGHSCRKDSAIRQLVEELHMGNMIIDKHDAKPEALIQVLLDINNRNGWLSRPILVWVSRRLGIPLTRVYHIATFYKAFKLVPTGRHLVQVCQGTACQVRGASNLVDILSSILHIKPGETDRERRFTLTIVNCLGCCSLGPVMMINGEHYSQISPSQIQKILERHI
jgi:NADH-quinone oxidoreductase subunit E